MFNLFEEDDAIEDIVEQTPTVAYSTAVVEVEMTGAMPINGPTGAMAMPPTGVPTDGVAMGGGMAMSAVAMVEPEPVASAPVAINASVAEVAEVIDDKTDEGLDRNEFRKLIKRMA